MTVSLKRFLMIMLGLCFFVSGARAQFYMSGEDPARLTWSQLNLRDFNIIYPKGQDSLAYQYATLLSEEIYTSMDGLNAKPRRAKIPVILHTYSANANAMVAWTPRRMEFFTIPSPEVSNLPWARSLVLHEGRHVGQMLRSGDGFFRGLHYLIGEQSEGIAAAWIDARGFFEGDAVMAETEYSAGGRGRQSEFLLPYRACFADSIDFSYDKWHFGSFKHYIPNEYALGYMKWTAGRAMNQAALPQPSKANAVILDNLSAYPLHYGRAYKRAYGMSLWKMWPEVKNYYTDYWKEDSLAWKEDSFAAICYDKPIALTASHSSSTSLPKDYELYASPQLLSDGSLLVRKSSLSQTSRVLKLGTQATTKAPSQTNAQTLFLTGTVNSPMRASRTHLYWTELQPHPRWAHQSYSVLKAYDLSGNYPVQQMSKKSLFFNPSPSADNRYLAVVEANTNARTRLLVLRTDNMEEVISLEMDDFDELKEVAWAEDNSCLYLSVLNQEGLRLDVLDLENGHWQTCIAPQHRVFSHLTSHEGKLYFDADLNGASQIYEFYPQTKELQQLTHARFGAKEPAWRGDSLCFLHYSLQGWTPAFVSAAHLQPQPASFDETKPFLIDDILAQEKSLAAEREDSLAAEPEESLASEQENLLTPKPYRKLSHLFKFHSWAPLYYDKDQIESFDLTHYYETVAPGLSLFTQNDLGTAYGQLGYSYHDGYHAAHARFTYTGLYPVFSVNIDYNDATSYKSFIRHDSLLYHSPAPQWQSNVLAYVPLSYRRNAYTFSIVPSLQWHLDNDKWYSAKTARYENTSFLMWRLQVSMSRDKALRDIKSPFYMGMSLSVMHPSSKELYHAAQSLFSAYAGVRPRILPHDGLSYKISHQRYYYNRDTQFLVNSLLTNRVSDDLLALTCTAHAVDYTFPVNMDFSIPGLLYIKRLETTLFAELLDFSRARVAPGGKDYYQAAGIEASFNLHPLRTNFNLNIGLRATLSQAPEGSGVEMILNVPYL